ncbi:DoxX family protein [Adhaeribacter radiodurans]|uniref:DoxX family protein n=1 Tax=Adhaeribacter radiodurans TaxID=2745197 RepID=UPI001FE6B8C5|nr:DoxX family protein [Adhaeribacter radiodurans]
MSSIQTKTTSSVWEKVRHHFNSVVKPNQLHAEWQPWEKHLFRLFFLFLSLLILPIDWKIYRDFFAIDWAHLHFHDLFRLSRYQNQFIPTENLPQWGIGQFANWTIALVLALGGAVVWGRLDANRKEYTVLYYWLRVIVRYRLAFVLITYGFIKVFPLQMPYPSLSNLFTNYGDFFAWKIYFQTVGIAPKYQSFLGFVEILAAFLLFNRRTTTFGVGLIFGFIGNVAVVNGLYDVGEQVLSTFIVLLATFLLANDVPRLYRLLIQEGPTYANKIIPDFSDKVLWNVRFGLRGAFLLFTFLFAYKTFENYTTDPYKIPRTPGLSNAFGYYRVKEFTLNNKPVPDSKTDPNRWQDVIFEKWSTLTIKSNRPVKIDFTSAEAVHEKDIDRNYELAGHAGRHYFYYEADTVNHTLALQNKNKNHRQEKLFLTYQRPNSNTLVLAGINETQDSIRVVLEKVHKKYMFFEGRRKPVKI